MFDAEHLIENVIFAYKNGENVDDVLTLCHNVQMLKNTGIDKRDLIRMASHVVYSLYEGIFPGDVMSRSHMYDWD